MSTRGREAIVGLILFGLANPAAAQSAGKVYVGDDGVEVAVVPHGGDKAILKVTGTGSALDGMARLHDVVGPAPGDYLGKWRGTPHHTLSRGGGVEYRLELPRATPWAPSPGGPFRVRYDEARLKALKAAEVVALHDKQSKDGTLAAVEAFNRPARMAEADKELQAAAASAERACGIKLKHSIEWSSISDEALAGKSVSAFCGAPAEALAKLCAYTAAKTWARRLGAVSCRFGAQNSLKVNDGTIMWTAEGTNMDQVATAALLGPEAAKDGVPWGKLESLAQQVALEKTALCTDGKAHYVSLTRSDYPGEGHLYWGDGKAFVRVPSSPQYPSGVFWDPRHPVIDAQKEATVLQSVEADPTRRACTVTCGARKIALQLVDLDEKRALLTAARFAPAPERFRPHALLRDPSGAYYLVDRGIRPGDEQRFRVFKGPKGALKEQEVTKVTADSEGETFSAKDGARLVVDRKHKAVWIQAGRPTKLRDVPVEENLSLIYNTLGVYRDKLGTPCDDL